MNKTSKQNILLCLIVASVALSEGCKPAKSIPAEEKKVAADLPPAISLQINNQVEVKVDSGTASKIVSTNLTISISSPPPPTGDKIPLKTDVPSPVLIGTPVPYNVPNLEPKLKQFPAFEVPVGTINLARGKKVISSDRDPVIGTLDLITDGDKAGDDGSWVELGQGKQWVQIDLEKSAPIFAVIVWHFHSQERVYRDVVVQVSDDLNFEQGVTTIYDNSANGKDHPYVETYLGKVMDAKGIKGRHVRLYSNGNTTNKLNHYIEVEVFGNPAT